MNIKITYNWLKEYLDTDANPYEIQKYLSLCGPSIERVEEIEGDYVFDVEVTSNRVDTASVLGIAREAQAIFPRFGKKAVLRESEPKIASMGKTEKLKIDIIDKNTLCNRLLAVVIDGVAIGPSSPEIKSRLEACGIRSLNNLIDITNYVMLEIGHPTHAFDYDRLKTKQLIIRNAKKEETFITLDGKKHTANENDVVIDDGTGEIIDLPGIMGTENSVITENTKRVLFFIESNNPYFIRKTSMRLGIRTDAATYNDKRPDPELAKRALIRGIELYEKHTAGKIASEIIDIYPRPVETKKLTADTGYIRKMIGADVADEDIINILKSLGFDVAGVAGNLEITVPTFRADDVNAKEDIVEEVARVYGYHNLPNTIQNTTYVKQPKEIDNFFVVQLKVKNILKHLGLSESMNYSMVSANMLDAFGMNPENHLQLANTISEEIKFLRRRLIPSLAKNINDNKGKKEQLKFFEIAKIYTPRKDKLPEETYKLGISVNTDFYDLKGIIESVLKELNISDFDFEPATDGIYAAGVQAQLKIKGTVVGTLGKIKKSYTMNLGYEGNIFVAEIGFTDIINSHKMLPSYKPPLQYAVIRLDHTHTIKENQTFAELIKKAEKISALLVKTELVSLYGNRLTLRFNFSSKEKNITEEIAKKELEKIVASF